MHLVATAPRRGNIKSAKDIGGNTVNPTNCMGLRAQILMHIHEPLCCIVTVVFLMKRFIQGLLATAPAAQAFHPLFLKGFLQLLTGQKNLSFCGYINDLPVAK